LDHQPLLVLTSINTCSQQLDKLLTSLVYESEVGLTAYDTILEFKTRLYTRVGCTSTTRIRRRRFFFLQVKKGKDFFLQTSYIKDTYVETYEFRQAWSVAKIRGTRKLKRRPRKVVCLREKGTSETRKEKRPRKARRWLPRRKGSVCPQPRNFFFWLTSTWVLRDPSCLNSDSYET
jgi:hypothetical protein